MQTTLTTLLVVVAALAGAAMAAPTGKLAARQDVITFGDDGVPSMSGANGAIIPYSNN